jgi:hypothetical protein
MQKCAPTETEHQFVGCICSIPKKKKAINLSLLFSLSLELPFFIKFGKWKGSIDSSQNCIEEFGFNFLFGKNFFEKTKVDIDELFGNVRLVLGEVYLIQKNRGVVSEEGKQKTKK